MNYKQEEDNTEGLFQKFKESEVGITNDVTDTKLFVDIEEEQEKRKERQEVSPRETYRHSVIVILYRRRLWRSVQMSLLRL